MAMFAGFLIAAIVYRTKPETHKRLMLLATLSIALVGMGRLVNSFFPYLLTERWLFRTVWMSPILLAVGYDLVTRRKIHPVYLVGTVLFLLRINRENFMRSELWLPTGRALLRPFL